MTAVGRDLPVADQSRPTIFRFGERRILKPWSAGLKAEKNPASEFVIVGGQSNMLDRDMDVAKASIDATTLVDSASAGSGVDEVDCACAGFACKGAGQPDRGALRERRSLACRDFNPLLMDGLDQKRTGGTNHCFRTAYLGLKREAAPGVDGETWRHYGEELEENLQELSHRLKRGAYRAKPVRRVYIPKADGRQRPLGVPALEDKIVQRAAVEVLNAIYETDFLGFS